MQIAFWRKVRRVRAQRMYPRRGFGTCTFRTHPKNVDLHFSAVFYVSHEFQMISCDAPRLQVKKTIN